MKFFLHSIITTFGLLSISYSETNATRVAALAIDRENGFYYGFASDQPSRPDAERLAIEEATKFGAKNPTVVLVWSGAGYGAYRTVASDVGNAYGWGVAESKEEADRIATAEATKRSNGRPVPNFAWAANSKSTMLKVEYNAAHEIIRTVNINGQIWALDNLQVDRFRNGDPIPYTTDDTEFGKWNKEEKKSGSFAYSDENGSQLGRIYNFHAIMDPRGIAPVGWRIPTRSDFDKLITSLGGLEKAGPKLRAPGGWPKWAHPANNASGFSALAGHQTWTGSKKYWEEQPPNLAQFWTSTMEGKYIHQLNIVVYDSGDKLSFGTAYHSDAFPVRLIKEQ